MTHLLVVDDDSGITELLAFKFRRAGAEVSVESDGESGLSAARRLCPDLIVLDWMMPRMNGLEVCRELRSDRDPAVARVPVLLLTARAQEPHVERVFAAGANDFVLKPFSPRELVVRAAALLPAGALRT